MTIFLFSDSMEVQINQLVKFFLTRISAAALNKFVTPQVRRLSQGGVYLKFGRDKDVLLNFGIVIFRIKLTELTPFDFDYIRIAALINFFLPNAALIRVNTVSRSDSAFTKVFSGAIRVFSGFVLQSLARLVYKNLSSLLITQYPPTNTFLGIRLAFFTTRGCHAGGGFRDESKERLRRILLFGLLQSLKSELCIFWFTMSHWESL